MARSVYNPKSFGLLIRMKKLRRRFRWPLSVQNYADELGVDEHEILATLRLLPPPLFLYLCDDEDEMDEYISQDNLIISQSAHHDLRGDQTLDDIKPLLKYLPQPWRFVAVLHLGLGPTKNSWSLAKIAELHGVSPGRIHQLWDEVRLALKLASSKIDDADMTQEPDFTDAYLAQEFGVLPSLENPNTIVSFPATAQEDQDRERARAEIFKIVGKSLAKDQMETLLAFDPLAYTMDPSAAAQRLLFIHNIREQIPLPYRNKAVAAYPLGTLAGANNLVMLLGRDLRISQATMLIKHLVPSFPRIGCRMFMPDAWPRQFDATDPIPIRELKTQCKKDIFEWFRQISIAILLRVSN